MTILLPTEIDQIDFSDRSLKWLKSAAFWSTLKCTERMQELYMRRERVATDTFRNLLSSRMFGRLSCDFYSCKKCAVVVNLLFNAVLLDTRRHTPKSFMTTSIMLMLFGHVISCHVIGVFCNSKLTQLYE